MWIRWISIVATIAVLILTSCSPTYVIRAGWEEAGILLSRSPIETLLESPELSIELRSMLSEVQRVKDYSDKIGLLSNDSFRYYSEVDRDVLVWVLSAAPKHELRFKTWWFPIVGSVPYKGFFEKSDGLQEHKTLVAQGYDAYLRPSLAFSTLGWFSDPLLSTMKQVDRVSLVDTVFHELLHNTVWVPNHVEFNESLANSVGAFLSQQYFREFYGEQHVFTKEAVSRWKDEVRYSKFLTRACKQLRKLYAEIADLPEKEKDSRRNKFFNKLNVKWEAEKTRFSSKKYLRKKFSNNNAALLAETIYLSQLWEFDRAFSKLDKDFQKYLELINKVKNGAAETDSSPFTLLRTLNNAQ